MSRGRVLLALGVIAAATAMIVGQAVSQETQQDGRGGRRGGPNVDQQQGNQRPGDFRQQGQARMKTILGATDEEWQSLGPKVEEVMTLTRELRPGMGMAGRGGRGPGGPSAGGPGGPGPAQGLAQQPPPPQSDVQKQQQALQKVLDNKESSPAEIKAALATYRDARVKAQAELARAQKDLRRDLTVRQEAQLVIMGLLD
jgi:hypothetical protein